MGTENESTAPETEVEGETPGEEGESDLVKDLRRQLRAQNKELKDLRPLRETTAYLEAGLDKLSEDQKTALKAVAGTDITKDNLIAKAKSLGFVPNEDPGEAAQREQIQGEVQTINGTEQAISGSTTQPDNRDLATKIRSTNSPEELLALLAQEGEAHGLLVQDEW